MTVKKLEMGLAAVLSLIPLFIFQSLSEQARLQTSGLTLWLNNRCTFKKENFKKVKTPEPHPTAHRDFEGGAPLLLYF